MSATESYQKISREGLCTNNLFLVQLLGLCPALAITTSVVNALGLGLATLAVMVVSTILVSLLRHHIHGKIFMPVFAIMLGALVCGIELFMRARHYELYQHLGIFIPLIAVNYMIWNRVENFALHNSVIPAGLDGFLTGLGFVLALVSIGALRELLGTGALFSHMSLLFGSIASGWKINILGNNFPGIYAALLPTGAFIIAGFLIAAKNYHDLVTKKSIEPVEQHSVKGSKRVRVTGHIR